MPRYDDDDDDDRPRRRRSRRDFDDDGEDQDDDSGEFIRSSKTNGNSNGFATTSMILGLVGFCVPAICGLLAILFGFLGLGRAMATGTGKGMAIAGIILWFLNGIVEPAGIGYFIYWTAKKTKQTIEKKEAEIQEAWQKAEEDRKANQKRWDDEQKEWARKNAEDTKRWDEENKLSTKKREEDRLKFERENKDRQEDFARRQEEARKQREEDQKNQAMKREDEKKMREEEQKLAAEITNARFQIQVIENACRTYTVRNKNKPPATLQALYAPLNGVTLLNEKTTPLKDPWGQAYQYEPNNKNPAGGLDPLVFTVHPKSGEKILSSGRK